MAEARTISLADLLVDTSNARLPKEHVSQQEALLAVANEEKGRLIRLIEGIHLHGLDPLRPMAVRPGAEGSGKYVVVEGNRRLTALKALESPGVIEPALDSKLQRRLTKLASTPRKV